MENYLFKEEKVKELLEKIKSELIKKEKTLEKAFTLDEKEWEYKVDLGKLIEYISEIKSEMYLPKFTKEEIVDGLGKIVLAAKNQNPYLIFEFVLYSIYTNNNVTVVLENKLLASNKVLLETIKNVLKENKYDENIVSYKEVKSIFDIVDFQDEYDLLYYFGNKEEYLSFIKRIHIDSMFENYGEIDVYVDSNDFKEELLKIDKFAYINEIKINYYNSSLEEAKKVMNNKNNINKISVIFTKDTNNAYKFVKDIKSENVYINVNPITNFSFNINQKNLVYTKKIIMK